MRRSLWEVLLLGVMMLTLTAGPVGAVVDGAALMVDVQALTNTDVQYDQDVLFEVTITNRANSEQPTDLWFTADLTGVPNEKPVTSPYLDHNAPLSGIVMPLDEVIIQLRARPLENVPDGPYVFNVKTGLYATGLEVSTDTFEGRILVGDTYPRGPGVGGDQWAISSVWAQNEAGRRFLARSSRTEKTVRMIQNYPNPFNPETNLTYEVKPIETSAVSVKMDVYNVHGHLIRSLVDGSKPAGIYTVKWDGRDNRGVPVQSGVYIFKLASGRDVSIRKGILTK